MKKRIIIILLLIILILITIFSVLKFEVINPISTLCGLYEVTFTDKEYTTIQEIPKKVMIVKNNSIYGKTAKEIFDEYMESRGFKEEKRQKQEGILVYSNGKIKENIKFLANKYYAKIDWE